MTENSVIFNRYEPADRAGCIDVFSSNIPEFFLDSEREEYAAFLDDLPGPYLTLRLSSSIVGCGGYALGEREGVADLCWGMIHSAHHGRGFGTLLTQARLDLAMQDPRVQRVALKTTQKTEGFYVRFGFKTEVMVRDGYGTGLHRCDMIRDVR